MIVILLIERDSKVSRAEAEDKGTNSEVGGNGFIPYQRPLDGRELCWVAQDRYDSHLLGSRR